MCGLGAWAMDVGCSSCWHGVQEQGHLLLLGWLRCPRPERVSQVLHCGPALSGPVLPGNRLPKVSDLPAVEQGLPHDLLEGHVPRADQPVGMQLPERLQVRRNPPWSLDALAREAGEGQPCAQLPQVLRLCWDCSPLLCCERHAQPSAEVGLPRHALGLQQAADDLGLESCQLCWDVHKGYASLLQGPRRDGPAGE